MVVLVCEVQLHLPESGSLKAKRQVLNSLKERLRGRFNLSVAEVDGADLWQRSTLAMAVVSTETSHAEAVLNKGMRFIEGDHRVVILDHSVERW